jgi:hypothetical protein
MRWVGWSEGWVIFNRDYILGSSLSGKYPIARYLYVYLNRKPCQPAIHAGYCLRARCLATVHATTTKDGTTVTRT